MLIWFQPPFQLLDSVLLEKRPSNITDHHLGAGCDNHGNPLDRSLWCLQCAGRWSPLARCQGKMRVLIEQQYTLCAAPPPTPAQAHSLGQVLAGFLIIPEMENGVKGREEASSSVLQTRLPVPSRIPANSAEILLSPKSSLSSPCKSNRSKGRKEMSELEASEDCPISALLYQSRQRKWMCWNWSRRSHKRLQARVRFLKVKG